MIRAENFRESKKKYRKEELVIPESRVIHSTSPSLPRHSQTHFSDKRRVSAISGDIYFDANQQTNIPQMAYQVASKQNKARRSLEEFEKQANLTKNHKDFVMSISSRCQPTIVPINPQTGKRVDVNPGNPIESLHLHVPISIPLANSPPASPIIVRKTPNIALFQKRNRGDQVISEIRRLSQPSNIAQGLNRMNLNLQGPASNMKAASYSDINVESNETPLERFNKETLVIGEICGQSMSDISGVRPVCCARRGSVIHNPLPDPQPSSNGGRRPSIYAQLDEFISNSAPTSEPLYRTFTVPKTTQNSKSSKRDSIELPSITLSEHDQ
ncbi:unnamed protein product, partial [Mesorhabditis belari]|uniref:Uncharacterized protein n=1 Tax=Mesorhabditis belari TaxID=2138241 RepID=A0AAF3FS19_9BILA